MSENLLRLVDITGDRKKKIQGIIPSSRATFYRNIDRGIFPKPSKINRISYWKRSDIEKIVNSL